MSFRVLIASIILAIAAAWTLAGPGAATAGEPMNDAKTGDLNVDGTANSLDALLVLFYDAGMSAPPMGKMHDRWFAAADVNCDVTVNSLDASVILQADAGLYQLRT